MIIYKPEELLIDLKDDIVYVLPNIDVANCFMRYSDALPEKSLILWALKDIMPENKVFVDIGAHIGTWTLQFAKSNKVFKIISFEPQKNIYNCLISALSLIPTEKATVHNIALSNYEGIGQLKIVGADGGGTSTLDLPTNKNRIIANCEVKTLDNFNLENIGLIKIDVEGAELEVIQGGIKTLERNNWPKIVFEAWPHSWYLEKKNKLFKFLVELGYRVMPISNYNEVFLAERV